MVSSKGRLQNWIKEQILIVAGVVEWKKWLLNCKPVLIKLYGTGVESHVVLSDGYVILRQ